MDNGVKGSVKVETVADDDGVDAVLAGMVLTPQAGGVAVGNGAGSQDKMRSLLNMAGATYRAVWAGRVPSGKYHTTSGWASGGNGAPGQLFIFERTAPDGVKTFIRSTFKESKKYGCEAVANAVSRLKKSVENSVISDVPAKYLK